MAASGRKKGRTAGATLPPVTSCRGVHVLSDSTGNLARHMLAAFLTQFPAGSLALHYETYITTKARLAGALEAARAAGAAVCHAMVSPEFKAEVDAYCRRAGLPCVDLTGHVVRFLSEVTGAAPSADRQSLHRVDQAYQRRIGAIEFTLAHDDGLGLETLAEADIVLAGVSRTSKTPTSMYLAQQGYRVANVALAIEVEPPPQLLALGGDQVVGLVVEPHELMMIRKRREVDWRRSDPRYGAAEHVARELAWTRRLFARKGWPVLDVTHSAIEETAARVLKVIGTRTAGLGKHD